MNGLPPKGTACRMSRGSLVHVLDSCLIEGDWKLQSTCMRPWPEPTCEIHARPTPLKSIPSISSSYGEIQP